MLLLGTSVAPTSGVWCGVPASSARGADDEAQSRARRGLDLALRTVGTEYPTVHARGRVVLDNMYDAVLTVAKRADTVIIGGSGRDRRISRTGLLVQPLTRQSVAPFVITPSDSAANPDGEVLVGITMDRDTRSVLGYAFEHARRHTASVRVVCCRPPRPIALDNEATTAYRETEERLFDTLSAWQNIYPDVRISSSVVAAHPTARLIADSEHARLLVIAGRARRGADWTLRHRIRRLLRWTRRPVAVVPAGPGR